MFTKLTTYLAQRSICATALCAALVTWYLASATVIPAALQMSRLPETAVAAEAQAEAGAVCVGMACSIEAKDGKGCCCAPGADEESDESSTAFTLTKDCDDLGTLTLSVSRSFWQMPQRVANLVFAPDFVTTAVVADDTSLHSSHPEDIEHIPILLSV